jgi:hypothetical protein
MECPGVLVVPLLECPNSREPLLFTRAQEHSKFQSMMSFLASFSNRSEKGKVSHLLDPQHLPHLRMVF